MSEEAKEEVKEKKPQKKKAGGENQTPDYNAKHRVKHPWTLARCQKMARRFFSEQEWRAGSPSCYKAAKAQGWMKDCLSVLGQNAASAKPEKKKLKRSA